MIADIILGNTIDNKDWIVKLQKLEADNIFLLDYDYFGEPRIVNNITYISVLSMAVYLKKFDSINFYKSMYGFPGMSGNMSSLHKT